MDTLQCWKCESCGSRRVYGNSDEPSATRVALLMCARGCKGHKHTQHTFVKVMTRRVWEMNSEPLMSAAVN